jgi:hypothetical protein
LAAVFSPDIPGIEALGLVPDAEPFKFWFWVGI